MVPQTAGNFKTMSVTVSFRTIALHETQHSRDRSDDDDDNDIIIIQ
jgi:hypothetical protein